MRTTKFYKFLADYIGLAGIAITLTASCVLIFNSMPFLGATITILLLGLGGVAYALLIKAALHMKRKRLNIEDASDT